MSKIKEIEQLLKEWKADSKRAHDDGDFEYEKLAMDRAIALESALAILKGPSNTQMQIDAPEARCHEYGKYITDPLYCPGCMYHKPAHD
jgi:hypothetical protein